MFYIATILLFDQAGRLLIYLRDDKAGIPFPNHWDLFGGYIEEGESPEQALRRELMEEIGIEPEQLRFYREFECLSGDVGPNIKYVFTGTTSFGANELQLLDVGQRIEAMPLELRHKYEFANVLGEIIDTYAGEKA